MDGWESWDTPGKRLRGARLARGLKQKELQQASGVTQSDISKLERGDSLSTSKWPELAQALTVSAVWLSAGKGTPHPTPTPAQQAAPPAPAPMLGAEFQELIAEWKDIPPWKRKKLMETISEVAAISRDERAWYTNEQQADDGDDGKKNPLTAELRAQPSTSRTTKTVKHGDGNPKQGTLSLTPARNPFDETSAPANEVAWYKSLAGKPKATE